MKPGDSSAAPRRQRRLAPLLIHGARALAATVTGSEASARRHYDAALGARVPARELVEIARMAHLFGGFPRAIQGMKVLGDALRDAGVARPRDPEPGSRPRRVDRMRGERLFRRVYGESSDLVLARLDAIAPGFSTWVLEDAYGRVLTRTVLKPLDRELLAVGVLTALDCPNQLTSHVKGAIHLGASKSEILAVVKSLRSESPPQAFREACDLIERLTRSEA